MRSLPNYIKVGGWLFALALWVILAQPAAAHTSVSLGGPYAAVVGWAKEPAIIGERNQITIEITKDGTPLAGVEAGLSVEVHYGGQIYRDNLTPTGTPGLYTVEIFPTVRGQYSVRLLGQIEDHEVDQFVDPEEVFPASRIQFPEALPDVHEMNDNLAAMQSQLEAAAQQANTAMTVGIVGVTFGLVGIILAGVTMIRARKKAIE